MAGYGPQRRFLDARGEGVFHLGFEANLGEATAQAQACGLQVLMSSRRDNRTGFVYFGTLEVAGLAWMCRQTMPL